MQSNEIDVISKADPDTRLRLGNFIKELNKREWSVRISKSHKSFDDYAAKGYVHYPEFGTGFVVNKRPVPYFHPNRSFHDEIIWLNDNLYYKNDVTFDDKLVNSAIVKFYGPARTLDIITGNASDLGYLEKTGYKYINFDLLKKDQKYSHVLMSNIEKAFAYKEKIWGTTELRTSLQTASRNYSREVPSPVDVLGVKGLFAPKVDPNRKMRPSDMIHWVAGMSQTWIDFYNTKPTMKESFEFLTKTRGIGNYYGYHFSSNLARMPGVGSGSIIDSAHGDKFVKLQDHDPSLTHGNIDENADYVVPGPGAMLTLRQLFPDMPNNIPTMMKYLIAIRDNQEEFFGIAGNPDAEKHLQEASELGRFTTFGIEISCCQFSVFERSREDSGIAMNRANAPISKIVSDCDDSEGGVLIFED